MIDIHTHILPFVDDGSSSLEESILLVKQEIENGVDTIVATPHHILGRYEASVSKIKESYDLLVNEVNKLGLKVKILLGQELCYNETEDITSLLDKKELLTLNDSNVVLLEFSFSNKPHEINEIIYNFKCKGYKVIVAHVERYSWINLDIVKQLKEEGAIIQVNSNSLVNIANKDDCKFARKLLRHNLIDIVASDSHSFRVSSLKKAYKKVKKESLFNFDLI